MNAETTLIKDFNTLLREFEELPEIVQSTSIFNITGYPHYENVASNILSFYFNPNNEHNLGSLFLDSLLETANNEFLNTKEVNINREVSTQKGGRIDIVIESDSQIIGIENKIFHNLANDLQDYINTLNIIANNEKEVIGIVLSIKKETPTNSFLSITYSDFFSTIKKNLGNYATPASQKWLLYLLDFMQTINELQGGDMEFNERDKFFIENADRINKLEEAKNKFFDKLNKKTNNLYNLIGTPLKCIKKWIYQKNCLVIDLNLSGHEISLDFYIGPQYCQLQLFDRKQKDQYYLSKIIENGNIQFIKIDNKRYILEELDIFTSDDELIKVLEKRVNEVIKAEENYNKTVS